jgi:D-glycero-alpha-D-manno-heptose 1-phosphate guanylyltransferase
VVADVPKPMAQVNNKPFLDYLLTYLKHYGVEKVVLSVGYLSEKVISHYGENFSGMKISYSAEKEPLGTGGGIRLGMEQCETKTILVLNGDSFFDINLKTFYRKHEEYLSECSLSLRNISNASRYGTIKLGELDMIRSFQEKTGNDKPGLINAGVYLLEREVFMEETKGKTAFSIEKDFFEKKVNKLKLYGFTYEGYFIDIGIPEDFKRAQHDFKEFKY